MGEKIKIMDERLAAKIAAGEVVERPASVVKELMENSIDSGATDITVTVTEGGRRFIKVSDNGTGMSRPDLELSLMRHATSKISTEDDLDSILTMGFRGEALWSISSVARVIVRTKRGEDTAGSLLRVEGGKYVETRDDGCPDGTSVEVRDLFYNTPGRAKFLRTPGTEFGKILDMVKKIALANPDKRFKLTHGSSKVIDTPAGELKQRVGDLFGTQVLKKLVHLKTPEVEGFVGTPELTYTTSKSVFTYVNNRPVTDRGINRSVILGFGSMLEEARYPFAVIDIKLNPSEVDVNVHPAKSEVRFKNPHSVYELVRTSVKGAVGAGSIPRETLKSFTYAGAEFPGPHQIEEARGAYFPDRGAERLRGTVPCTETFQPDMGGATAAGIEDAVNPEFLTMEIVGQLWGEFLITEGSGEFYIIDQHGAAERSTFERLRKQYYDNSNVRRQLLLLPEKIDTTPQERDALNGVMPLLEKLGFDIIPFGASLKTGGETFMIKAVPEVLSTRNTGVLVKDLAEELSGSGVSTRIEDKIDEALMRIACHSVIRGARILTREEAKALLKDLSGIDFAGHCPHGRPVVRRFSRRELETMFKR